MSALETPKGPNIPQIAKEIVEEVNVRETLKELSTTLNPYPGLRFRGEKTEKKKKGK